MNPPFDWSQLRAFLHAAEAGSFTQAARSLGCSQPTVGRQVAALEADLGLTLFERAGGSLQLTEAGRRLLPHARAMGEAADTVSLAAAGAAEQVHGLVRITASELICAHLLGPPLLALRKAHPGIHVDLVADHRITDLTAREADLAIRNVAPEQPELIGRRLRTAHAGLYASPAYLSTLGSPPRFADATFLAFERSDRMKGVFLAHDVPVGDANFPLASFNQLVQWGLAQQGLGIAFVMTEVGEAAPGMVRVLPHVQVPVPLWLVCHRELRTSRRLRLVFDVLATHLGAAPEDTTS